jgi:mono/diheme cytochrome c family protein
MRQRRLPFEVFAVLLALGVGVPFGAGAEELGGYDGAQLFKRLCSSCHGPMGAGDGPVAASFKTRLPDLSGIAARSGGVFPAERVRQTIDGRKSVAAHGARDMPVWGKDLRTAGADADAVVARLVEYLRALQGPGRP